MNKKHSLRFCLCMNPCDPAQTTVARILNTKGRGISDFVARAVMYYIRDHKDEFGLENMS